MKHKIFFSFVFIFFLAAFAAAQSVDVTGSIGAVKRGAARGTVVLNIQKGFHINSNRPTDENLIATVVRVSSKEAKTGAVSYPRGAARKFGFSEKPLSVYENRAQMNFSVTVPANFKGNTIRVRVVVKYQACNEEACFAPKEKEITLTANVK